MTSHAAVVRMFSGNKNEPIETVGDNGGACFFFGESCKKEKPDLAVPYDAGPRSFSFIIDSEMEGHRLDFAVSRLLGVSRAFAQKLIKAGDAALFPERRIKPSIKVLRGDILNVEIPPAETMELEPEEIAFEVIYSDADIAVINKPARLVVHPAPGHWTGTLVHGLLYKFPDLGTLNGVRRPGIVHRLDATTSGLMVVAKNGLAQEALFHNFKQRRVEKEYLALCWGVPLQKKGTIDLPIDRDPCNRLRMAVVEDGRESRTDYSVLWSSGGYSLVRCLLHTGRTHQIRVHMQAIKHPLVGDQLYAPSRKSSFGNDRVFLHSWKLAFTHPRSNKRISFTCPLPGELSSFLRDILSKKADQR